MYIAGIMNHFSSIPKMELIVWGSSVVTGISTTFKLRSQFKSARLTAGDIKPGSTGPRIWTNLAISAQMCGFMLPSLVYMAVIAHNKFRQPEWMTEYALPPPPDIFGVDGVTVGRAVGLLARFAGANFSHTALKALGDQYHAIGVSALPSSWIPVYLPVTYIFLSYRYGRNPGSLTMALLHMSAIRFSRKFPLQYSPFAEPSPLRSPCTVVASLPKPLLLLRSGHTFLSTPFSLRSAGAY